MTSFIKKHTTNQENCQAILKISKDKPIGIIHLGINILLADATHFGC